MTLFRCLCVLVGMVLLVGGHSRPGLGWRVLAMLGAKLPFQRLGIADRPIARLHRLRWYVPALPWIGRPEVPLGAAVLAVRGIFGVALIAAAVTVAAVLAGGARAELALLVLALAVGGGVALPAALIGRAERRCASALADGLPDLIDLLADARAAGREPSSCMETLVRAGGAAGLARRLHRRVLAGSSIAAAMDIESRALDLPVLRSAALVIARAEASGAAASPGLRALAAELRSRRQADLLRRSGRAGPVASLITALAIAPGTVAILAAVLIGGDLGGGGAFLAGG
jgi:pilus assembly protein TadC